MSLLELPNVLGLEKCARSSDQQTAFKESQHLHTFNKKLLKKVKAPPRGQRDTSMSGSRGFFQQRGKEPKAACTLIQPSSSFTQKLGLCGYHAEGQLHCLSQLGDSDEQRILKINFFLRENDPEGRAGVCRSFCFCSAVPFSPQRMRYGWYCKT